MCFTFTGNFFAGYQPEVDVRVQLLLVPLHLLAFLWMVPCGAAHQKTLWWEGLHGCLDLSPNGMPVFIFEK